jgi:outer membrane protein assembly factor BamB
MRIGSAFAVVVAAAAFVFPAEAAAPISSLPDRTVVANARVNSIVRVGGTVYIGGYFSRVGPRVGPWAAVDASSGQIQPGLAQVSGGEAQVLTTASDGSGGWYIGGSFTHVGGVARAGLAHVRADGTLDPTWDPAPNGLVWALARSGSTLFVGGRFTSIGGQARTAIAALDSSGKATNWNAGASSSDPMSPAYVRTLLLSGTTLYVGGNFTGIGGESAGNLAALDASTGGQLWTTIISGFPAALAVSGSTLYIGGNLYTVSSQPRPNLAAVNTSNGSLLPWTASISGVSENPTVSALAATNSAVYVGGLFNNIGGQTRNYVAALDPTTAAPTAWNPNADGQVRALVVSGSTLLVGGFFGTVGGQERVGAAAVSLTTGALTGWNPAPDSQVNTIATGGSKIALGGLFTSVGSVARGHLAAIDASTGALLPWNPSLVGAGLVNALAANGSRLYVGGAFHGTGSAAHPNLAAFDTTTGNLLSWGPTSDTGEVRKLALQGSTLYAAGDFAQLGSQPRQNLAALDATTGQVLPWNPSSQGGRVWGLVASASTVYVGGEFTQIGGQSHKYLVALNASDGKVAWDPGADGFVDGLALSGQTLYVGGTFSNIGGQPRQYIGALNAANGKATPWNPGASSYVYALAPSGSSVFAGGDFATIGSKPRPYLAELDATTGTATNWAPGAGRTVLSLLGDPDGTIYAGGDFATFDQSAQASFASFSVAPRNTAVPTVGAPHVGKPVTCSPGTWAGTAPRYAYTWLLDEKPIAGQVATTLTPVLAMAGHRLECAVTATNLAGTAAATSASVRVPPKPAAVTRRAKRVGRTKARLRGLVNPHGEKTTYYFLYGRTKRYGHRTRIRSAGVGLKGRNVVAQLRRLRAGKTYHFRLVAKSASGVTRGRDLKFRTKR